MVNDKAKTNMKELKQPAFTLPGGRAPGVSAARREDGHWGGHGFALAGGGIRRNVFHFSGAVFSCDCAGKTSASQASIKIMG